jgi:hypothetical protein
MKRTAFIIAVAVLALAGCGERGVLEAKRQRWAVEQRALDETLDQLEERLLGDQARVHFWQEMRDRHEGVTAVACTSLEHHADGIALFEDKQREKRDTAARRNRVALRFVSTAGAVTGATMSSAADER